MLTRLKTSTFAIAIVTKNLTALTSGGAESASGEILLAALTRRRRSLRAWPGPNPAVCEGPAVMRNTLSAGLPETSNPLGEFYRFAAPSRPKIAPTACCAVPRGRDRHPMIRDAEIVVIGGGDQEPARPIFLPGREACRAGREVNRRIQLLRSVSRGFALRSGERATKKTRREAWHVAESSWFCGCSDSFIRLLSTAGGSVPSACHRGGQDRPNLYLHTNYQYSWRR